MSEAPVQTSGPAPAVVEDPIEAARTLVADPAQSGTPEWLAAQQLLTEHDRTRDTGPFADLEREMQALKGMSEI